MWAKSQGWICVALVAFIFWVAILGANKASENNREIAVAGAEAAMRLLSGGEEERSGQDYRTFVLAYEHTAQQPILKEILKKRGIPGNVVDELGTGGKVTVHVKK